jgi:DNA-binding PadR family transcriptional regulator
VQWRIDPYELRRKQYLLTPKGRELAGRLLKILGASTRGGEEDRLRKDLSCPG